MGDKVAPSSIADPSITIVRSEGGLHPSSRVLEEKMTSCREDVLAAATTQNHFDVSRLDLL